MSVLGELSGTLAHELNQPLAAIGNYAQSLVRRADNGRLTDGAVREAAGEISAQAERAAGILGRIRTFARKRLTQRTRLDPALLLAEAVGLFRGMLAHAPPVTMSQDLPAGVRLEADGLQIQQVLVNLLKNGLDAMAGLPSAERRLDTGVRRGTGRVVFSVRDFGTGLGADGRCHLFEPFFTTKPDGLGLGLSICKTIAEAHGGRLEAAAATDGSGMVFTLILPCHE